MIPDFALTAASLADLAAGVLGGRSALVEHWVSLAQLAYPTYQDP